MSLAKFEATAIKTAWQSACFGGNCTIFMRIAVTVLISILMSGCSSTFSQCNGIGVSTNETIIISAAGRGGSDLYTLDIAKQKVTCIAKTPECESAPSLNGKGDTVVYSAVRQAGDTSHIFTTALNGKNKKQLTFGNAVYDDAPSFSQDGKHIVFARASMHRPYSMGGYTWDHWDIYTIGVDGSGLRRLTNKNYREAYYPRFCGGNSRVIFSAYMGTSYTIVDINLKPVLPISKTLGNGTYAACSSNGKNITFVDDRNTAYEYELWTANNNLKLPQQLTHLGSYITCPSYSPDGRIIYFLSDPDRNGENELWSVNVKSGKTKRVAGHTLFEKPFTWKP